MNALGLYKPDKKIQIIESQRPTLSKQELESVLNCLIEDKLGSGEVTKRFEKVFANTFGFSHAIAVNSLSSAYHLALLARDAGPDDYVIMSALAPVGAYDAANYTSSKVILLDIDRNKFHPDTNAITETINQLQESIQKEQSSARIFFVLEHSFGSVFNLDRQIMDHKNLIVIEDITGVVGRQLAADDTDYIGKKSHVCICGLSQYDLLTTGNGAIILQDDSRMHNKTISFRYGPKRKKGSIAWDYRLEDFQAAIGLDQISRLTDMLARRSRIGRKYLEALKKTRHISYYKNPQCDSYLNFPVVFAKNPDEVQRYYASLHIGIEKSCNMPLHHIADTERMKYPNAERFYQKSFSIPSYPALTSNNVERIAASLRGLI